MELGDESWELVSKSAVLRFPFGLSNKSIYDMATAKAIRTAIEIAAQNAKSAFAD